MTDTPVNDARTAQPLRIAGVVGLIVAAVIHIVVAVQFGGIFGVLFVLSAIGMAGGAALLLLGRVGLGWVVGGGVAILTALGYVLRSTVGLPFLVPHPVPFDRPFIGAVSAVVEFVVALLAVWALSGRRTS